jgi:hypothetical protein
MLCRAGRAHLGVRALREEGVGRTVKATTEELVAAYESAGKPEKKFVRDLMRAGKGEEARVVCEILEAFPHTRLIKRDTLGPTPG